MSKLNSVLDRVIYRGDKDKLVLAVNLAISAGKEAQRALEQAYGKKEDR